MMQWQTILLQQHKGVGLITLNRPHALNALNNQLIIEINQALLDGDKTKVKIGVYNGNKLLETTTTNFLGPRTFN